MAVGNGGPPIMIDVNDSFVFNRKELHHISVKATAMAKLFGQEEWAAAYRRLAAAADELDERLDQNGEKSMEIEKATEGCLEIRFAEHPEGHDV